MQPPRDVFEDLPVEDYGARRQRQHAAEGGEEGALAGAVGADDGDDLAVARIEVGLHSQGGPADHDGSGEAHAGRAALSHRPRRMTSTKTERASRTRLRRMAASGLVWSSR